MAVIIARQEVRLALRQRWVLVYAAVFAALTAVVSYFGLAVVELTGWQELDRTAASVLTLVLYVVPLASMLMAVQSLRPEGGASEQLFAEPLGRAALLAGKMAGLAVAHSLATLLGFGFTAALVAAELGTLGLAAYAALAGFTALLGYAFLGIGALVTVLAGRTSRAYAAVLAAWFAFTLLFDLLVIGVSFLLPDVWATRLALAGVLLDPVDATRVAALLVIAGRETFGLAGAELVRALGGTGLAVATLVAALVAWSLLPLAAAAWRLGRQDL